VFWQVLRRKLSVVCVPRYLTTWLSVATDCGDGRAVRQLGADDRTL